MEADSVRMLSQPASIVRAFVLTEVGVGSPKSAHSISSARGWFMLD